MFKGIKLVYHKIERLKLAVIIKSSKLSLYFQKAPHDDKYEISHLIISEEARFGMQDGVLVNRIM